MSQNPLLPLLLGAADLEAHLGDPRILILDVCSDENYQKHHIPGAIHITPSSLQCGVKPAAGKLPSVEQLTELFSAVGLQPEQHVIVYDDEGGGWAGRLIWTLDVLGHQHYSYLDGGLPAWLGEGRPVQASVNIGKRSDYHVTIDRSVIAEADDIMARLGDTNLAIWDARSSVEYEGIKVLAERGGHIPGAVNLDWLELMDRERNLRLIDLANLQNRLNQLGLTADKNIVTHCHSHHRSGLSYLVMKILGYPNIKGYHGSWSEWGNRKDTPIETSSTPTAG